VGDAFTQNKGEVMSTHIDASVQTQAPSYYIPTVASKIQNLEKIYFVAGRAESFACLVFTDEKTRDAANKVFKGLEWCHPSIPEKLNDSQCLTVNLDLFGKKGFLDNIQSILVYLGKQMKNSEQNTKIPIFLAFAEVTLY